MSFAWAYMFQHDTLTWDKRLYGRKIYALFCTSPRCTAGRQHALLSGRCRVNWGELAMVNYIDVSEQRVWKYLRGKHFSARASLHDVHPASSVSSTCPCTLIQQFLPAVISHMQSVWAVMQIFSHQTCSLFLDLNGLFSLAWPFNFGSRIWMGNNTGLKCLRARCCYEFTCRDNIEIGTFSAHVLVLYRDSSTQPWQHRTLAPGLNFSMGVLASRPQRRLRRHTLGYRSCDWKCYPQSELTSQNAESLTSCPS